MAKKVTPFRLEPDLVGWLDAFAKDNGVTRTRVVEELLYALRENRLRTIPREGPSAFPGEQHANAGETPEFPILVAPSTRDQVGPPDWRDCGEIPLGESATCNLKGGGDDG